jgi:hypothetical protein
MTESVDHATDAPQGRFANEAVRRVRPAVCVAQEMGARLGRGAILFGCLPQRQPVARPDK